MCTCTPFSTAATHCRAVPGLRSRRPGALFTELGCGRVATLTGRYYAMDRDNHWDRIERAYRLLTEGTGHSAAMAGRRCMPPMPAGRSDEFVLPTVI